MTEILKTDRIYDKDVRVKFNQLWKLVGKTPMIVIDYMYKRKRGRVYAKCEHYNLTGSIKDRMALYILQKAYEWNRIKKNSVIAEATSGNTGISFCALGNALGHKVKIIMPDWLSKERFQIIESMGGEIIRVSKEEGGFLGSIALSEKMAWEDEMVFLPRQFENQYNAEAHEKTTGREIWEQLRGKDLLPDAFVAGVGTGGTIMGTGQYLKSINNKIKIHPIEPTESPTLSTGFKAGSHRIQGISDEFIPALIDLKMLDEVIQVNDGDAILMAQLTARKLGLAVGISSGANLIAAIKVQDQLGGESTVVTVLPDSNKKYLSTGLMDIEKIKEEYITNDVELLEFGSV